MAPVTKAAGKNIPVVENTLELYVDPATGIMMVKDWKGNQEPFSNYISGTSGISGQPYFPNVLSNGAVSDDTITTGLAIDFQGDLFIGAAGAVEQISFPNLTTLSAEVTGNNWTGGCVITRMDYLTEINLPALQNIAGSLNLRNNAALTLLDLSALQTVGLDFNIVRCGSITQLNLSNLISTNNTLTVSLNTMLNTLTFPSSANISGTVNYNLSQNALSQASVDSILVSLDNGGASNGNLDISGGTNAAPGVAGAAAVISLTNKGWTVSTN